MKDAFRRAVNNGKAFLLGSMLTIWSGYALDNPYIEVGGAGLAVGAMMVNRERYKCVPPTLLLANVALTVNGTVLAGAGEPLAGLLLASANSLGGYGLANLLQWGNRISPKMHGGLSTLAGAQIVGAGVVLNDPLLTGIGALFMADGIERAFPSESPLGPTP